VWKCDFEAELANAIAWQTDEGSGNAAELRSACQPRWPRALLKRSTNRVATRRDLLKTREHTVTALQKNIRTLTILRLVEIGLRAK
jgi:hypothetical protein